MIKINIKYILFFLAISIIGTNNALGQDNNAKAKKTT